MWISIPPFCNDSSARAKSWRTCPDTNPQIPQHSFNRLPQRTPPSLKSANYKWQQNPNNKKKSPTKWQEAVYKEVIIIPIFHKELLSEINLYFHLKLATMGRMLMRGFSTILSEDDIHVHGHVGVTLGNDIQSLFL